MAIEDRHILPLDGTAEYLGVPKGKNYPFRLVYFKKDPGDGEYKGYMTDASWPDMGFAFKSMLPVIQEANNPFNLTRNRRDSFFGIINTEETLQPHELDFQDMDGVEVVDQNDPNETNPQIFMVKGGLLRLPLYANIGDRLPICPCACGALNQSTFNMSAAPDNTGVPSVLFNFVNSQVNPINTIFPAIAHTWSWSESGPIYGGPIQFAIDTVHYSNYIYIVAYSPQYAPSCAQREPPVFTHPTCPNYEMAEYWVGYAYGYRISDITYINPGAHGSQLGTVVNYETEFLSPFIKQAKIGEACYTIGGALQIGDNTVDSWNNQPPVDFTNSGPDLDTLDLPEGLSRPPDGFPDIRIAGQFEVTGRVEGILRPCVQCRCVDKPSQYNPACV